MSTDDEKIISNNEGNKELHGDWLLVTRKKKTSNNPAFISTKTVTHKSNRFNALSHTPQNTKPGPHTTKLPPRLKPNDTARASKTKFEPKRRRSDETNHDAIFNSSVIGPAHNNMPGTQPQVFNPARNSPNAQSPIPTPHFHVHLDRTNPTQEKATHAIACSDTTTQTEPNKQHELTSNNPHLSPNNNIVTSNDNKHINKDNEDMQMGTSAAHHDSREENMEV